MKINDNNKNLLKGAKQALKYARGNKKKAVTHKIRIPEHINVLKK